MEHAAKFAGAKTDPFWFSTVDREPPIAPPAADFRCDLAIIGGGFTGLWSALKARARMPDARITVLEAGRCGGQASGRNGGFCAPSISHGVGNALARWPDEAADLIRLGQGNLDDLEADLDDLRIDAGFERAGKLHVAATPWQVDGLRAMARSYDRFGIPHEHLTGDALRAKFDSPVYSAGLFEPLYGLVNPAQLVDGLRRACLYQGIEIFEDTSVSSLDLTQSGVALGTSAARVTAKRVIMATNVSVPLLRHLRSRIIPIYDYSLVTAPLSDAQLAGIGWSGPHGVSDTVNQFHYLRKTADNRMLWAGYDAIYHYGSKRSDDLLYRAESFDRLAGQFAAAFPTLSDVTFDYAWGGIIDTSARTTFFAGTALDGRVAYALGFTGQGVTASRFAALTMLDLLDGADTARTRLAMHQSWPVPFPPEPLRSAAIAMAQRGLAHEDRTGHRPLLLRTLDRFGIGFDS